MDSTLSAEQGQSRNKYDCSVSTQVIHHIGPFLLMTSLPSQNYKANRLFSNGAPLIAPILSIFTMIQGRDIE
jgi:hypothetical protein